MNTLTKVIIVGPKPLYDYFTSLYQHLWDTQRPVETVQAMWDGLQDGSLDRETDIVLFVDQSMDVEPALFAPTVASFTPSAAVLVVFYNEPNKNLLDGQIAEYRRSVSGLQAADYYPIYSMKDGDIGEQISRALTARAEAAARDEFTSGEAAAVTSEEVAPVAQAPVHDAGVHTSGRKKGFLLASTSSKGGSGKTTVALLTATSLYYASKFAAEAGLREKPLSICVVDMDTRDGQIGFLLNQMSPTALNIVLEPERDEETIRRNLVYAERLGFHALLAPKRGRTADYTTPEFYAEVIEKLQYMFDVVVIDTSVNYLDRLLGEVVLPMADQVLFVTNLSLGSVFGMNRWLEEVTTPPSQGGSGLDLSKVRVVVNQSLDNVGIDAATLQASLKDAKGNGVDIVAAVPLDTASVTSASNHQRLNDIILFHPDISEAYYRIISTVFPEEALIAPLHNGEAGKAEATESRSATAPVKKARRGLFGGR